MKRKKEIPVPGLNSRLVIGDLIENERLSWLQFRPEKEEKKEKPVMSKRRARREKYKKK